MVAAAQVGVRRQVGEIVFLLSRQPVFADEPSLIPRQMLLTMIADDVRAPAFARNVRHRLLQVAAPT